MGERATLAPGARRALFDAYGREAVTEWIQARGRSMEPLVRPGSWMLVEFGAGAVRVGDIVLFSKGDEIVAHRVVASRPSGGVRLLVTKGDAEPYREAPLHPREVIGVVRALRPRPDGPPVTVGAAGASARFIAFVSNTSGRTAMLATRAARRLPDPLRRPTLRTSTALSRVAGRAGGAPFAGLAQLRSKSGRR